MYNTVSVRSQDIVVPGVMTLTVLAPEMAAASAPGQFYMLKSWREQDPFLMRPISIDHIDVQAGTLTFLYKVVGRGTELLSHLRGGDTLELLGPLGKGFPIDGSCRRAAVIGRGIGIAPLRPLVEQLRTQGTEVYAYLSAKSEDDLFHQELFRTLGAVVRTTTAPNERITDAFAADAAQLPFDAAYSCGSNRLAAHMKQLHAQHGFPAYVSLEEHMACGVGACKGCICTAHDKDSGEASYVRVCKSGPVFDVDRVL